MRKSNSIWIFPVLGSALALSAILGLSLGSTALSPGQVLSGLFRVDPQSVETMILWAVRLPRVAAGFLAGFGLAVSGLLLQAATNNPLAGPNIIGVNAGAGFAMVLCLFLAPMAYRLAPFAAFLGAFGCTLLIVSVSNRAGGSRVTVILTGVALTTLLSAGISLIKLLSPELAISYNHFSAGGVSGVQFPQLMLPGLLIFASFTAALLLSRRLDLLCLGDSMMQSLGFRPRVYRTASLLIASCCAAAAVSFAGLLGFVGLMVPHIIRKILPGAPLKRLLPACAILGGILVILADLAGRVLFAPSEVPAGIITALLGAPFFFILLLGRRDRL